MVATMIEDPTPAPPPAPANAGGERIPTAIWVLVGAALVIAVGYGLISPVLPNYAKSFDVGVTATSVIFSAFALCRLVFAPAGGKLVTRFGERPVYLSGLLIVAASTGATALAGNYWQLLVFRALGGIGSTMFTVSAIGLIVRLSPPAIRGRVSSAYASAWLIGGVLGPVAGGQLAGFGYRVPFAVYAIALLGAVAVVAVMLPGHIGRPPADGSQPPPMPLTEALRDSAYRAGLISGFANGWTNFGVRIALIPLLLSATLGASDADSGHALAIFALGNAVTLSFSGRLSDRIGRRPLLIGGLLVNGVLTGMLAGTGSLPLFLIVSAVSGMGVGLFNPAQQAVVADIVGPQRGAGAVLPPFQMAGDLGAIIGPIAAGALVDSVSYASAFAVSGAVVALAAVPWLFARETVPRVAVPAGAAR